MLRKTDIEACTRTLAALDIDKNDDVRTSLAWMLRNRIEQAERDSPGHAPVFDVCNGVLEEALGERPAKQAKRRLTDADRRHIHSAIRMVWQDGINDRTSGAIACHKHDLTPKWAKNRTPTALLGSFLFFR